MKIKIPQHHVKFCFLKDNHNSKADKNLCSRSSWLKKKSSKLEHFTATFFGISHQTLIAKTRLSYRNFKYEVLLYSHLNFIQNLRHSVTVQLNKNSWLQITLENNLPFCFLMSCQKQTKKKEIKICKIYLLVSVFCWFWFGFLKTERKRKPHRRTLSYSPSHIWINHCCLMNIISYSMVETGQSLLI